MGADEISGSPASPTSRRRGSSDLAELGADDRFRTAIPPEPAWGSYLGLRPRPRDSGENQPPLRITRAGDRYLRPRLVPEAHYIFSAHGPDTDLKRWGKRFEGRGGRHAQKRAVGRWH